MVIYEKKFLDRNKLMSEKSRSSHINKKVKLSNELPEKSVGCNNKEHLNCHGKLAKKQCLTVEECLACMMLVN